MSFKKPIETYGLKQKDAVFSAFKITFRKPKEGEFGAQNMGDGLLYAEPCLEKKPLEWFFGMQEHGEEAIWRELQSSQKMLITCGEVVRDGSYPIDDLELEMHSLASFSINFNGSGCGRSKFIAAMDVALEYNTKDFCDNGKSLAVITGRAKPEDFLNEIENHLYITTFGEMNDLIRYVITNREDSYTTTKERPYVKALYQKVFGEKPTIRCNAMIAEAKAKIWQELVSRKPKVPISSILELADVEKLEYFIESAKHGRNNFPTIIDGRSLLYAAIGSSHRKDIFSEDELYFGKLEPEESLPREFFLTNGQSYSSTNIKIQFNSNKTSFHTTVVGMLTAPKAAGYGHIKARDLDVGQAKYFMKRCEEEFPNNTTAKPGYVYNIPVEDFNKVFSLAENMFSEKPVPVVPQEGYTAEDWTKSMKVSVACNAPEKQERVVFCPFGNLNISDMTKNDLAKIERTICDAYIEHYKYPKTFKVSAGNRLKEDIQESVATNIAHVYQIIRNDLHFMIKIALGGYELETPYMITDMQELGPGASCTEDIYECVSDIRNKKESYIMPTSSFFEAVVTARSAIGDESVMEMARTISKGQKIDTMSMGKKIFAMGVMGKNNKSLHSTLTEIGKNHPFPYSSVIDVSKLNKDCLWNYLLSAAMNECIENETLVSFRKNKATRMIRPKDVILSVIKNGSTTRYRLLKSIYADKEETAAVN